MAERKIHKWAYWVPCRSNPAHAWVKCGAWKATEYTHLQWRYVTCKRCRAKREGGGDGRLASSLYVRVSRSAIVRRLRTHKRWEVTAKRSGRVWLTPRDGGGTDFSAPRLVLSEAELNAGYRLSGWNLMTGYKDGEE